MKALLLTGLIATLAGCSVAAPDHYIAPEPVATNRTPWQDWNRDTNPIVINEGCVLLTLTQTSMHTQLERDAGCAADERYAAGTPNGSYGNKRLMFDACYKRTGNMLELRWVHGAPKGLRSAVIRRPFPTGQNVSFPKHCTFTPSSPYILIPDRFLR